MTTRHGDTATRRTVGDHGDTGRRVAASILALDIGGANLKAAHSQGAVRLQPFELWKAPDALSIALRTLLQSLPRFDHLAVTMTGELCDCYETKRQGVNAILDAVTEAAANATVRVWQTTGEFVDIATARARPLQTAASNWLALAQYSGQWSAAGLGLVIDIGSTTTDIVPLLDGKPVPSGRTDLDRLRCQELIYTGVRRTPVCALLGGLGAAELFATTRDVYLLLGLLPEDECDRATADGRPATRDFAHARLARMFCTDVESYSVVEARQLALQIQERQMSMIRDALLAVMRRFAQHPRMVVLAGAGEFLAREVVATCPELAPSGVVSLEVNLGPAISQAACAYGLAVLAAEQAGPW